MYASALRKRNSAATAAETTAGNPIGMEDSNSSSGLRHRKVTFLRKRVSAPGLIQVTDPQSFMKPEPEHVLVAKKEGSGHSISSFDTTGWSTTSGGSADGSHDVQLPVASVVNQTQYLEDLNRSDRHVRRVTIGGMCVYLTMVMLAYHIVPVQKLERIQGIEHTSALLGFVSLLLGILLRLLPYFYKHLTRTTDKSSSGVLVAAAVVQFISMTTNFIMATFPTPVVIDQITGNRVHLLRWCEWTPLAFILTFLTEVVDVPDPIHGLKISYLNAWCMGLSTMGGFIFPFCPGWRSWSFCMSLSVTLYSFLFPRLYHKIQTVKHMKRGNTLDEMEHYERARLSLQLMLICSFTWNLLVVVYFVSSCGSLFLPIDSLFRHPAFPMVGECWMDVVAKVFYLFILVDAHHAVFDKGVRTKRRLEELRRMMSVVWESSSDVLVISVKSLSGSATTIVSPTFMNMLQQSSDEKMERSSVPFKSRALVFDLDSNSICICPNNKIAEHSKPKIYDVDFRTIFFRASKIFDDDSDSDNRAFAEPQVTVGETTAIAQLVARAWKTHDDCLFMHDLVRQRGDVTKTVHCEAKVRRLDDTAIVVVVRDISERFKRFEAESRARVEQNSREKDAKANRFTKHEVKNGLLAAIGLCDTLGDSSVGGATKSDGTEEENQLDDLILFKEHISTSVVELKKTLGEVLETIMAEAMARDVVDEIYQPKNEIVDLTDALCSMKGLVLASSKAPRFPVITKPSPLPTFSIDPQLLKFIHRNAISNACKYGQKGGVVTTEVHYDAFTRKLRMDVINLPGPHHAEIVESGLEACVNVFRAGHRLRPHLTDTRYQHGEVIHSAGDGAWIMQKCAAALGGECLISFEKERTVFSLICPTNPCNVGIKLQASMNLPAFNLPLNTWGIGVDDSKIQRKLLHRLFVTAGISEERIIILGNSVAEIRGFSDYLVDFVDLHTENYVFAIVDETMQLRDLTNGDEVRVSGSICIQSVRDRLMPDSERRMLAVVRSASDSSNDLAIYNSRAHGFLPKTPITKYSILDLIAPLWKKRFPCTSLGKFGKEDGDDDESTNSQESYEDNFVTLNGIIETVEEIDSMINDMILDSGAQFTESWPVVWEKLHYLKGDLQTMSDRGDVKTAVSMINSMRGAQRPDLFLKRWGRVRTIVVSMA